MAFENNFLGLELYVGSFYLHKLWSVMFIFKIVQVTSDYYKRNHSLVRMHQQI